MVPRRAASAACLLSFALLVFASHWPFVGLPYYWDELGQFIPAALDIFRDGAWIPHSTVPNIHPPAVMGYLAAAWRVFGFHPAVTRCAMLALATCAVLLAWLLARELGGKTRRGPALLTAAMLIVSPVFFAQAMMAQLDAPAMLFTSLALLFFLRGRIRTGALVCVILVLVKETSVVVPLVCCLWLARERRWREAAWYLAPLVALGGWMAAVALGTGHWLGNADFARYNLYETLEPSRIVITLVRRLYALLIADFHWVGTAAVAIAGRKKGLFRDRSWRLAGWLVAVHVAMFTLLGGAVLNRYLLPILPLVYAAMAMALSELGRGWRLGGAVVLLVGLAAANFINPPYPFPLEESLAFTDYLKVHADAAKYLETRHPGERVDTMWPMTAELSRPEFGFLDRGVAVRLVMDLAPDTLERMDWNGVQILAAFSRDMPHPPLWRRFLKHKAGVTREEVRARVPFAPEAQFERRGQWVDVYLNPAGRNAGPREAAR